MTSLHAIVLLYKAHLRARPLPELLALLGIAAGVALLFAVQVANKSVTGSFDQLTEGIVGHASLEVAARGPQGFDQKLFHKVKRLPDIEAAAPIVERRIAVRGPKGRRPLTLFGFDERLKRMGGKLVRSVTADRDVSDLGLYLTEPTAETIGVAPGGTVTVEVGERIERLPLAGVVSSDEVGSLAQSPVAVAHLGLAQEIAAMPDSITRILVAPAQGRESEARASLKRVSAGKLNVRASNSEAKLLSEAATSYLQSSALFSAVSLVVGILLAYNAMLLTITARRRDVAGLHMLGASNKTIIASLAFDALMLGIVGSLLGIFLGDLLSRFVLHEVPGFLSSAFAVGSQRVVELDTVIIAMAGGTLAALAATARPAVDLLKLAPQQNFSEQDPDATETRPSATHRWTLWGGISLIVLSIVVSLALPKTTIFMVAALILGMVLILHPLIVYLLTLTLRLARRTNSAPLRIAVTELAATPTRATALATIGAVAVFAILGITGPARDMQRGMAQVTKAFFGNADIWVLPKLEENPFVTLPFNYEQAYRKVKQLPAVESVRIHQGSFIDWNYRRLLVSGEPRTAQYPIASRQIVDGDIKLATQRFRQGGWAALTETVAKEHKAEVGQEFILPTPSGNKRFKLAAKITNYSWPSGTLIINASDYRRAWNTRQASALQVYLADGVTPNEGKLSIQKALGKTSSLSVRTADEGNAISSSTTDQALARLDQIADIVLIAAVLAVAAAMLGSVWQRRRRLWGLVSLGMGLGQLYRTVFFETAVILMFGCLVGVAFGLLGQYFGGRWLHITTAFPMPFVPALGLALKTFILVIVLAVLAVTLPTRFIFSRKRVAALTRE